MRMPPNSKIPVSPRGRYHYRRKHKSAAATCKLEEAAATGLLEDGNAHGKKLNDTSTEDDDASKSTARASSPTRVLKETTAAGSGAGVSSFVTALKKQHHRPAHHVHHHQRGRWNRQQGNIAKKECDGGNGDEEEGEEEENEENAGVRANFGRSSKAIDGRDSPHKKKKAAASSSPAQRRAEWRQQHQVNQRSAIFKTGRSPKLLESERSSANDNAALVLMENYRLGLHGPIHNLDRPIHRWGMSSETRNSSRKKAIDIGTEKEGICKHANPVTHGNKGRWTSTMKVDGGDACLKDENEPAAPHGCRHQENVSMNKVEVVQEQEEYGVPLFDSVSRRKAFRARNMHGSFTAEKEDGPNQKANSCEKQDRRGGEEQEADEAPPSCSDFASRRKVFNSGKRSQLKVLNELANTLAPTIGEGSSKSNKGVSSMQLTSSANDNTHKSNVSLVHDISSSINDITKKSEYVLKATDTREDDEGSREAVNIVGLKEEERSKCDKPTKPEEVDKEMEQDGALVLDSFGRRRDFRRRIKQGPCTGGKGEGTYPDTQPIKLEDSSSHQGAKSCEEKDKLVGSSPSNLDLSTRRKMLNSDRRSRSKLCNELTKKTFHSINSAVSKSGEIDSSPQALSSAADGGGDKRSNRRKRQGELGEPYQQEGEHVSPSSPFTSGFAGFRNLIHPEEQHLSNAHKEFSKVASLPIDRAAVTYDDAPSPNITFSANGVGRKSEEDILISEISLTINGVMKSSEDTPSVNEAIGKNTLKEHKGSNPSSPSEPLNNLNSTSPTVTECNLLKPSQILLRKRRQMFEKRRQNGADEIFGTKRSQVENRGPCLPHVKKEGEAPKPLRDGAVAEEMSRIDGGAEKSELDVPNTTETRADDLSQEEILSPHSAGSIDDGDELSSKEQARPHFAEKSDDYHLETALQLDAVGSWEGLDFAPRSSSHEMDDEQKQSAEQMYNDQVQSPPSSVERKVAIMDIGDMQETLTPLSKQEESAGQMYNNQAQPLLSSPKETICLPSSPTPEKEMITAPIFEEGNLFANFEPRWTAVSAISDKNKDLAAAFEYGTVGHEKELSSFDSNAFDESVFGGGYTATLNCDLAASAENCNILTATSKGQANAATSAPWFVERPTIGNKCPLDNGKSDKVSWDNHSMGPDVTTKRSVNDGLSSELKSLSSEQACVVFTEEKDAWGAAVDPRFSSFRENLSNEQQTTFSEIIAHYEAKINKLKEGGRSKASEVEILKGEMTNQHNQIQMLLEEVKIKKVSKALVTSADSSQMIAALNEELADLRMRLKESDLVFLQGQKGKRKLKRSPMKLNTVLRKGTKLKFLSKKPATECGHALME